MKEVIIISDYQQAATLSNRGLSGYYYITVDMADAETEYILKKICRGRVELKEGLGRVDFKKEYLDFIGRINRHYDSLCWWATTASYKGTFVSNLWKDIFNYYCLTALIQRQDRDYVIFSNDPHLVFHVRKYCLRHRIKCSLLGRPKKKGYFTHLRKCLASSIYFLRDGWMRKYFVSRHFSNIVKGLKKDKAYYVIRSWVDKRSFEKGGFYKDLYFGALPEHLEHEKKEVLILVGALVDYKYLYSQIKQIRQHVIIPQEFFVGYIDYIKALWAALAKRPEIKGRFLFCGADVTDLMRDSVNADYAYGEIFKNLIYYYKVAGLCKRLKIGVFTFPLENHAWERMSLFAIRNFSPSTRTIGYAHSTLPPYLLNYFYSAEEEDVIPLPDKIITTGRELKTLMEETGNYKNKGRISEGCALRYEYIFKTPPPMWNKNGRILATFSMDIKYAVQLMKLLEGAFNNQARHRLVLRPHPFTPLDLIIKLCGSNPGNNFAVSENKNFRDDLSDVSALIYTNATTAVEALTMGVPVVHVDLGEPISLDPLFRLNGLKWTVSDQQGLLKAVEHIRGMEETEYADGYKKAKVYLKDYFYPVEEKYLKEFV